MPPASRKTMPDPTAPFESAGWVRILMDSLRGMAEVVLLGAGALVYLYLVGVYVVDAARNGLFGWVQYGILLLPPMLALFAMFRRSNVNHMAVARKLLGKRRYMRAIPHLHREWEEKNPEAARLLGDMCAHGWGVEAHSGRAAAFYRHALDWQEGGLIDMGDLFGTSSLFGEFGNNTPKNDTFSELSSWYRHMVDTLESLSGADEERHFVLALLYERLDDAKAAVASARSLPDKKEGANRLAALLAILPGEDDGRMFGPPFPVADERMPGLAASVHIDRISCLKALLVLLVTIPIFSPFLFGEVRRVWLLFFTFLCFAFGGWLYLRLDRKDRFPLGEEYFRRGFFTRAARIFSFLCKWGDPRAFKRLGDMHAEGLGLQKDPERALTAFRLALASMQWRLELWKDPWCPVFFRIRGLDYGPEALAGWYAEVMAGLEKLGEAGNPKAYDLLVDVSAILGDTGSRLRYARKAWELSPTSYREIRLADALCADPGYSLLVEEGTGILQRYRAEGNVQALDVVLRHAVIRARSGEEGAGQALAWYRELRAKAQAGDPDSGQSIPVLRKHAKALLRAFGPEILSDDELVVVLQLRSADETDRLAERTGS